ncbi:MAG: NAD(P)/FAD-dependent oxidoreductase [Pseudanabaenaceae cyanobacterium]
MSATKEIIVIGAGIAGLACASKLLAEGCQVKILEKSPGVGGRMATRRVQGTWVDHGTQYFKVTDYTLARLIDSLLNLGIVQVWDTPLWELKQGKLCPVPNQWQARYICPLGMTALAKYLAHPLQIQEALLTNVRITAVAVSGAKWQLKSDRAEIFSAPILVSTIPAPQFLPLFSKALVSNQELLNTIAAVEFVPSLSVMAGYDMEATVPPEWYAISSRDDPYLSWICLNSAKAGQVETAPVFVCHSSPEYAQSSLEENNLENAGKPMLKQLGKVLAPWLEHPLWWQVHRWRYALVADPLITPYLLTTKPAPLICAGDWCGGKDLQSAYLSGLAAADAVLDLLSE